MSSHKHHSTKWWGASRIILLNILSAVLALLVAVGTSLPHLQPSISQQTYAIVVFMVSVLTIFLRSMTKKSIRRRRCKSASVNLKKK